MRREASVGSDISHERPRGSERYWLVVGRDGARSKTLTLHSRPHGEILPVFGSEEDVSMFLTPLGAFGGGFMARLIAAEDLASLLWGPLSSVETVALDPTSGVDTAAVLDLVSTNRKSFVDNLSGERTLAGRGSQDAS